MNIYELNKILSSANKSKIIAHFWFCNCEKHGVSCVCLKLNISQPNFSKHIATLLKFKILQVKQVGTSRYYLINNEWKQKWEDIVLPQIRLEENRIHMCSCNSEGE